MTQSAQLLVGASGGRSGGLNHFVISYVISHASRVAAGAGCPFAGVRSLATVTDAVA